MTDCEVRRAVAEMEAALKGALPLERLHATWPPAALQSPFCRQVFEDLEEVVEHWPAEWGCSALEVDLVLLRQPDGDATLLEARRSAVESGKPGSRGER